MADLVNDEVQVIQTDVAIAILAALERIALAVEEIASRGRLVEPKLESKETEG